VAGAEAEAEDERVSEAEGVPLTEMELENKLAAKDVAPMETLDEVEPPVSVEAFVSHSG